MANVIRIFEKAGTLIDEYHKKYPTIAHIWNKIKPKEHIDVIASEEKILTDMKRDLIELAEDYVALSYIEQKLEDELRKPENSPYREAISNALEEIAKKKKEIFEKAKDQAIKHYWISNFGYGSHYIAGDIETILLWVIALLLTLIRAKASF